MTRADSGGGRRSVIAWGALLGALVVVALALVFSGRFGSDPTQVDSPLIGRQVPPVQVQPLEGGEAVDVQALRERILVVNFFASWCTPCREEHAALASAQQRYADDGVLVMGIVYQDEPEQVRRWLAALGEGYAAFLDPGSRVAIEFGVFGIPETFFVDRDGTVVAKIFGPADEASLSAILDQMLAGGRPESRRTGPTQPGPGG